MGKVVFVTGYKAHELGIFDQNHEGIKYIKKALLSRLLTLLEEGMEWVIITGQPGVELWAAQVVFDLQEEYPDLKLGVLLPYLNQEENWKEPVKELYEEIMLQADYVEAISKKPYEGPWQLKLKNQFIVDKSDEMLILYDDEKDGSPKYSWFEGKKKQNKQDYPIIQITFWDLQSLIDEAQWEDY
ncbi:DUF1273 family protein [Pradoshia sp. D12]|uniref:DUF1273 domain-containing protein n=1 Tax=Bacillaceae TaxID=186817 RepID=UPI0011268E5D|nr:MULTISPECIES: DUF1273 domain-containing protein [Bacillaceae]QFK71765.1 DUF1273 family protein [Pradoshia sp. D12]TPF73560.1 DUF1273 domain-containing protein [Bacillus sp. D12]